jgi:hypothetical protein
MNAKNLIKKIRRLVDRIEKDTRKLAKFRLKLTGAETKKKSQKTKKAKPGKSPKVTKRAKPRISAERRAELSAAMKARWAAKRAAASGGSDSSAA